MRKSYEKSAKDTFLSQQKDVQTGLLSFNHKQS